MPPELPDVIGGETVESEWGNDIRDRTVQRYANAAERSSLHASPVVGDLAFLEDTGLVYVFFGSGWKLVYETHGARHTPGGPDPLGDHGSAHANAGSDDLGGAISGYVSMGAATDTTHDVAIDSTFEAGAATTFNKPAGWSTYTVMAWGSVVMYGFIDAIGGARINISSNTGSEVLASGTNAGGALFSAVTIPAVHGVGGLTADAGISIQYRETAPTMQKRASTIQYIAIRTS